MAPLPSEAFVLEDARLPSGAIVRASRDLEPQGNERPQRGFLHGRFGQARDQRAMPLRKLREARLGSERKPWAAAKVEDDHAKAAGADEDIGGSQRGHAIRSHPPLRRRNAHDGERGEIDASLRGIGRKENAPPPENPGDRLSLRLRFSHDAKRKREHRAPLRSPRDLGQLPTKELESQPLESLGRRWPALPWEG